MKQTGKCSKNRLVYAVIFGNGANRTGYANWLTPISLRILTTALILSIFCGKLAAQPSWVTGKQFEFNLRENYLSARFDGGRFRDQIQLVTRNSKVAIWIDREVNPETSLELQVEAANMEQIAWLAAERNHATVYIWNDLLYIGPAEKVARLTDLRASLAESLQRVAAGPRKKLGEPIAVSFPRYTAIVPWLKEFVVEHDVAIRNLDDMPYDVWDAIDTPEIPLVELIALIAIGFDQWPEMHDDGSIELQAIDYATAKSSFEFAPKSAGVDMGEFAERFGKDSIKKNGKAARIVGSQDNVIDMMRYVAFAKSPRPVKNNAKAETRFSLTTSASRGQLLATVASQKGLTLEYSRDSIEFLNATIKVDLQNVTLDEVLEAAVEGSALTWRIEDNKLMIEKSN
ncbi:MAG: hypothetical protein R3C03_12950 [Pirellulaceae bacterium]